MGNWRIVVGLLVGGAAVSGWCFQRWRRQRLAALAAEGVVVQTAVGPVEYAEAGSGPVVVASHGGPGGYDQLGMLADLVQAGFRVIVPSRPGYLGTPLASGATPAAQADALAAFLDVLNVDRVAVVGVSAGGPVALHLALRQPQRVQALCLLAAVTKAYRPAADATDSVLGQLFVNERGGWLLDVGAWLLERLALHFPLAAARLMMQTESTQSSREISVRLNHMRQHPGQAAWFRALMRSAGPLSVRKTGLDNDLAQLAALPPLPLGEIDAPTLVVHGRADADVDFSHARLVVETVPGAELLALPDSGHLIWLGAGWEPARARLTAFLRQHAAAGEKVV